MRWLRTIILFDCGNILKTTDWAAIHTSLLNSIKSIEWPEGSGGLTLRRKFGTKIDGGKTIQWSRNGVGFLKKRFFAHMVHEEKWQAEGEVDLKNYIEQPVLKLYPSMQEHQEPVTSEFGDFDFVTTTPDGIRVAVEWETGNISSSHRSLNKLAIVLAADKIQAGVLILPSRLLYEHLTDRIGNIGELSPYLGMWKKLESTVKRGALVIVVVEHDQLTDDPAFPYLTVGNDGRAAEGKKKKS